MFLSAILEICDRYQQSPRMQVIRDWNQRDLDNMRDHTEKQNEIQKLSLLRDAAVKSGDRDASLEYAQAASDAADHFLHNTTNRRGETVSRKPKYKTDYLRDLAATANKELNSVQGAIEEERRKEEEQRRVREKFKEDYTTTKDGIIHATQAGVTEEETRRKHSAERTAKSDLISTTYVNNEDIEERFVTEEDFNEKTTEQEQEIAVDFQKNNDFERLDKIRRAPEVNTGVTYGKEDIQNIQRLEDLMGDKTVDMVEKFTERAEGADVADREVIQEFQENLESSVHSGELGRDFTRLTREDGLDVVRFGDDFRRSQGELADFIVDHAQEDRPKDGKIINFAEAVKQQRQQEGVKHAA